MMNVLVRIAPAVIFCLAKHVITAKNYSTKKTGKNISACGIGKPQADHFIKDMTNAF